MSLIIMEDDHGRDCAFDPKRIELIRKYRDGFYGPGEVSYNWGVRFRCGAEVTIPCLGPVAGPEAETMTQFFARIDNA